MASFEPVTRIEMLLNEIAENTSGGGGGGAGLPAVTSEDNGDVLTVVEGEWAKAAPSGGGALVEEFTWGGSGYDEGYYSTDDASAIWAAYRAGQTVIFHFPYYEPSPGTLFYDESYMTLGGYSVTDEALTVFFADYALGASEIPNYLQNQKIVGGKLVLQPYWE